MAASEKSEDHALEKTYHEWLTEALARDEQTWTAVERQLRRLRLKRDAELVTEPKTAD
jgi:hypothetical protein